ncbi:MAG: hypothetical protein EKK68_04935 [Candidatus Competibacteraceae bacterium]|nr:MAG: hypothetical protein EKK68_04935 [Candidatus Competibacteraceae bacterium]
MDTPVIEADDGASGGLSYVLREEAQLAQVWTAQNRTEYGQSLREIADRFQATRQHLDSVRAQIDTLWERFTILTLERILSGQLREFLDEIDGDMQNIRPQLTDMDCVIDRLRAYIQERRGWLGGKTAILEPLAHRTSTQNYLALMMGRVEGLEAYLLGRKDGPPETSESHHRRHTTLPNDLLYLRVRLLTTRIAITASNRCKQLSDLDAELAALLPDVERLKTEFAPLITRFEAVSELSRYWSAYLDITVPKHD